jgi:hypothetical protein
MAQCARLTGELGVARIAAASGALWGRAGGATPPKGREASMVVVRALIWIVTAFFVVMMFYPLVVRMVTLLMIPSEADLPY